MRLRARRNVLRSSLFLLGLGLIVAGVLIPMPIRYQVLAVILGLLVYQTMLLGLFDRFLPNERRYIALREETDRLLDLVRDLNHAAIAARAIGIDRDQYVMPIVRRMHETVDRMPQVAAQRTAAGRVQPWLTDEADEIDEGPRYTDRPRLH